MATDVFISYSRKNSDFARKLVDALTAKGRNSWVDWEGIPYSADWWREICAGIDAADTFVFIITPDSLASEVCNREFAYAHKAAKRIIPVVHQSIDEKTIAGEWFEKEWEATARENWSELKKLNWLFFRDTDDFDKSFASLIETAEQDPEHVRQHTRLLVRAREWEANGRNAAYALRGDDLREAEIWQAASAGKKPPPNELHTAYILASQQVRKDDLNRTRSLTQARFGIVLAIALFAVVGLLFLNLRNGEQTSANATLAAQSTLANDNLTTAVAAQATSERRADEAQSLSWAANAKERNAVSDPFTALSLAMEANRIPNPPYLAQQALADIAYAPGAVRQFKGHSADVMNLVKKVAWSSDGQFFVTVGGLGEVFLWDKNQAQPIRQFKGHHPQVQVNSVAWNPDGTTFVTVNDFTEVFLWDKNQEQPIRQFTGNLGGVTAVAWNPDGQFFVTVSDSGDIFLWDKNHDTPVRQYKGHYSVNTPDSTLAGTISSVAWNPDGKFFVTAGYGGEVFLWNKDQTEPIRQYVGHDADGFVNGVAWNADGQTFATVGDKGKVFLWDKDQTEPIRQYVGHDTDTGSTAQSVAWNADGQTFVTVGSKGQVFLWDKDQAEPIRQYVGHSPDQLVSNVAWNTDGVSFVTVGYPGEVFLWNKDQAQPVRQFKGHAPTGIVDDVAWSPDGHSFVTVANRGEVFLWDKDPAEPVRRFMGHDPNAIVYNLAWNPDGQSFVTVGYFGEVFLWHEGQAQPVRQFIGHDPSSYVYAVAWNPDGRSFVTVGGLGEVFLWDKDQAQPIRQFIGHNPEGYVNRVAWNPDGKFFVTIGDKGEVFLWDKDQDTLVRQFKGHDTTSDVNRVAWNPDGQFFVTTGNKDEVFLWDKDQDTPVRQFKRHDTSAGNAFVSDVAWNDVAWNKDGRSFITVGSSGEVFLWDKDQDTPVRQFKGHDADALAIGVAWNPDGQTFVTTGNKGEVFLWDKDQDTPIRQFVGHDSNTYVYVAAWNRDGERFVTVGYLGEVFLWDKNQGQPIRQFKGHNIKGNVHTVAWDGDGTSFVTVGDNGFVFLWRADSLDQLIRWTLTNRVVPMLTCSQRVIFAVAPYCDAQGTPPVLTAYPTASAAPTTDLTRTTATPT